MPETTLVVLQMTTALMAEHHGKPADNQEAFLKSLEVVLETVILLMIHFLSLNRIDLVVLLRLLYC